MGGVGLVKGSDNIGGFGAFDNKGSRGQLWVIIACGLIEYILRGAIIVIDSG